MLGFTRVVIFAVLLPTLVACASSGHKPQETRADLGPEALVARYAGTLPCADCAGIRTVLEFYKETQHGLPARYVLQETYLGTRDGDRTFSSTGRWTILRGLPDDPNATLYQLDFDRADRARNFVKLGEHELLLLDRAQRKIQSFHSYTLTHVNDQSVDPVVVTISDVGRPIQLVEGQWLIVRLPSNPSTGFRWLLAQTPERGLSLRGYPTYIPDSSRHLVGEGGIEIWHLATVRSGEHMLRFEYRRRWEEDAAAEKEASFIIKVAP